MLQRIAIADDQADNEKWKFIIGPDRAKGITAKDVMDMCAHYTSTDPKQLKAQLAHMSHEPLVIFNFNKRTKVEIEKSGAGFNASVSKRA